MTKALKKSILYNLIRTLSSLIIPVFTFPYISRVLGPENVGRVNFSNTFVNYFVLLSSFGIPLYGVREVARVRNDPKTLQGVVSDLFNINLLIAVLVYFILVVIIFLNSKLLAESNLLFIFSFSIFFTAIGMDWLFQGLEEYKFITIRSMMVSLLSIVFLISIIQKSSDYVYYAYLLVGVTFITGLINFFIAYSRFNIKLTLKFRFSTYFRPLFKIFILNFLINVYVNLDVVILGFLKENNIVGYYSTSVKLVKTLLILITSVGTVFIPRLSFHVANNHKTEFADLIYKSLDFVLFIGIPIVVLLFNFSEELIFFIAGRDYIPAAFCLQITAPLIILIGITNVLGIQLLYPLGYEIYLIKSVGWGALVSVVLNFLLIPIFSHTGAAFSSLIAELTVFIAMCFFINKKKLLNIYYSSFKSYLVAGFFMYLFVLILKYYFWSPVSVVSVIIMILSLLVYLAILLWTKNYFAILMINFVRSGFKLF